MADFPLVGVREFREKVATYKEPVTVVHTRGQVKVLGTWYPDGWVEISTRRATQSNPRG